MSAAPKPAKPSGFVIGLRIVLSFFLSFPLALASLAIAYYAGTPDLIRWIISPGYVISMHTAWGHGWDSFLNDVLLTFAINTAYFAIPIFFLLQRWNVLDLPRNPRNRFWMEK